MNKTPAINCKYCRFYHGANQIVCALHPYGPDSDSCIDYAQKASSLNGSQISRYSRLRLYDRYHFHNCKLWELLMLLSVFLGIFSFECSLGWLIPNSTTSPTTTGRHYPHYGHLMFNEKHQPNYGEGSRRHSLR